MTWHRAMPREVGAYWVRTSDGESAGILHVAMLPDGALFCPEHVVRAPDRSIVGGSTWKGWWWSVPLREPAWLKFLCAECGEESWDTYMLRDELWRTITKPGERYLHLRCAARRAGRMLTLDDLSEGKINDTVRYFVRRV